ncbi:MAG TPA: hypothetical protein VN081_04765 [Dongiaceae bacterium]|nr:hypothetical protein [Dongiaceae bacterium]
MTRFHPNTEPVKDYFGSDLFALKSHFCDGRYGGANADTVVIGSETGLPEGGCLVAIRGQMRTVTLVVYRSDKKPVATKAATGVGMHIVEHYHLDPLDNALTDDDGSHEMSEEVIAHKCAEAKKEELMGQRLWPYSITTMDGDVYFAYEPFVYTPISVDIQMMHINKVRKDRP